MTPFEAFFIGFAPAGGGLAMLSEAFSRKRDLLPLVRHPCRPLREQGDGFVHARGRLEVTSGDALETPEGRLCVAYGVRVEARTNLGDNARELWRRSWRPRVLVLRDDTSSARVDESVSLYFGWRESAFEIIRERDGSIRLQPAAATGAGPLVHRGAEVAGRVQAVRDNPDELAFARAILQEELAAMPPDIVPAGAVRHAVLLWATAVDDIRLFGPGQVLPDPEGDRGGGYREVPSRLLVRGSAGTLAQAEPFHKAERILKILALQYRGGLGMLAFGAAWALGFFLT